MVSNPFLLFLFARLRSKKLFFEIDHLNRIRQIGPFETGVLPRMLNGSRNRTVGLKVSCAMSFVPCTEVFFMNRKVRLEAALLWMVIMVCLDHAGPRKR